MAASLPTSGTVGPALARVAHQLGATRVARADVPAMLSGLCAALVPAAGASGVVLLLGEPADPRDPAGRSLFASDDVANRLGLIQQRAGRGPVPAAVRGERALTVPDLTRSGPPELAAAAADCGLVRSLVVPVPGDGHPAGGLQLLTGADRDPDEQLAAALWPVVSMLAAKLSDVREMARLHLRVAQLTPAPPADPAAGVAPGVAQAPASQSPEDGAAERTRSLTVVEMAREARAREAWARETGVRAATAREPGTQEAGAREDAGPRNGAPQDRAGNVPDGAPMADLFAAGEPVSDTPAVGHFELGWEGPPEPAEPAPRRARPYPARVRVLGPVGRRRTRPGPSFVPDAPFPPDPAAGPEALMPDGPAPERPEQGPSPEPVATGPAGRGAEPAEAPVPAQRSGPAPATEATVRVSLTPDAGADEPTWRVPRHRLRDDEG